MVDHTKLKQLIMALRTLSPVARLGRRRQPPQIHLLANGRRAPIWQCGSLKTSCAALQDALGLARLRLRDTFL